MTDKYLPEQTHRELLTFVSKYDHKRVSEYVVFCGNDLKSIKTYIVVSKSYNDVLITFW